MMRARPRVLFAVAAWLAAVALAVVSLVLLALGSSVRASLLDAVGETVQPTHATVWLRGTDR